MAARCLGEWRRAHGQRRVWAWLLPVAALALNGCWSSPRDASAESEFLQENVISAMTRWAGTASEGLPLARLISSQRFDHLCTVPEYQSLSVIESEVPVVRYHGQVGNVVPESQIAVIGVRGDTAHVAYIRHRELSLYNRGRHCYSGTRVLLRRSHDPKMYSPGAFLGEE